MMTGTDVDKIVSRMNGDLYGKWSEKVGGDNALRDFVERVLYYAEEDITNRTSATYEEAIKELAHGKEFYEDKYNSLVVYMLEHARDMTSFTKELNDRVGEEE